MPLPIRFPALEFRRKIFAPLILLMGAKNRNEPLAGKEDRMTSRYRGLRGAFYDWDTILRPGIVLKRGVDYEGSDHNMRQRISLISGSRNLRVKTELVDEGVRIVRVWRLTELGEDGQPKGKSK